MRRRRWAACDLHIDDGPSTAVNVVDQPSTVLEDDPDNWTDDDADDVGLSAVSVSGEFDCVAQPVIASVTSGCSGAKTRSHFRSGCRTVSRHPAPNMPMIVEDEQTLSGTDDNDQMMAVDIPTMNCDRFAPPAESPPLLRPRLKSSSCSCSPQMRSGPASVASTADDELLISRRVETPTDHGPRPAPPMTQSPSLLDAMHKKYCAVQYARHRTAATSPPGCHDNAHLLEIASRTIDRDCTAVELEHCTARRTNAAKRVAANHVMSSGRGDGDAACVSEVNVRSSLTSSTDVTSSMNTSGLDDDEMEDNDDQDDEEREEEQRNKIVTDDQPWKKRFCDYCQGELEVNV